MTDHRSLAAEARKEAEKYHWESPTYRVLIAIADALDAPPATPSAEKLSSAEMKAVAGVLLQGYTTNGLDYDTASKAVRILSHRGQR